MKIKNRQISSTFKEAKKHLKYATFICVALDCVRGYSATVSDVCESIIKERLEGCYTLETWLESKGFTVRPLTDYREEILAYRHRWLDALIEEFNVEGYYENIK